MEPINDAQRAMAERIAAYGRRNGIKQHLIDAAVKFAYIESRLGLKESQGNADGLFQYMPARWKERHKSLGDRQSADNQIIAMFRDLQAFERRYNNLSNPRIPRDAVKLEEYLYIKHHDGPNGEGFVPGLLRDGQDNGLKIYREHNPKYDASWIFGPPKTSIAPIRNPWEITFGLPGGRLINWFQPASLKLNNGSEGNVPAAARGLPYGPSITPYGPPTPAVSTSLPSQSLPWPVVDNPWRTPEPHWGTERRGYIDSHHYDPDTGASVSTRHRFKRSITEMTEAMASAAPPAGLGAGASEPAASISRQASLLAVQA